MLHFLALQNLPKNLPLLSQFIHIVTGTRCDCGFIICRYDVHAYNGSDCGFHFIDFIKLKDIIILGRKSVSVASQ